MHITVKISVKPFRGLRLKTFSVLLLLTLFAVQRPFAQMADNFSDGDFTTNPVWNGTTSTFVVNSLLQLQLNATAAGTSFVSTDFPDPHGGDIEWRLYVKQSFAPSAANFGRFYLMTDQLDLSSTLNGYYLQFGEAGSVDAIELFRQSGNASASVCRARAAGIATAFEIRIKVTRSRQGRWDLYVDYSGGEDFVLEASGTDNGEIAALYTGIFCSYTITNVMRFFFDDVVVREIVLPDTSPPRISSLEVVSKDSLRVVYSEKMDRSTASSPLNYVLSRSAVRAAAATLANDGRTVELSFSESFKNGEEETLVVKDVNDLAGNFLVATEIPFLYFSPNPVSFRDIIISEIFPDPSPQVGLPEAEFFELYNRSKNPVDLSGWTVSDGTTIAKFPPFILLPDKYLIVSPSLAAEKYSEFGQTFSPASFPALNNAGDFLILKQADGRTVDSLNYGTWWYRDDEKSEGGWSLELIDPQNICADESNWQASEDERGGTPGQENSVFANKPDNTGPKVLAVYPIHPDSLLIIFDEKLESRLPSLGNFTVEPALEKQSICFSDATLTRLTLVFSDPIQSSKNYSLAVCDVYDCSGNIIQKDFSKGAFVFPEKAAAGDILVNEVLFNPRPTGVDFVEIFNASAKTVQLDNWALRNFTGAGNKNTVILQGDLLIRPNEYKVFTADINLLKGEYVLAVEETFVQTNTPALNDDEGAVTILDNAGTVIDSMTYSDKMHTPFIRDVEGVSLERISVADEALKASNWRSASSAIGFATPGYANSNTRQHSLLDDGSVIVEPEIFQPQDYSRAFAQIKYKFDRGGFIGNIKIFDSQGRCIKRIAENELLATEGFFVWEGDRDNGGAARIGYYLVWFQIFDDDGFSKTFKKRVALY
jgi:hypothetical protein